MSFISIIRKIGETVVSVVEWPIKHSEMLFELLGKVQQDIPETRTVLVGLVEKFESIGPDAVAAIAEKGFNIPADLKSVADIKSLFAYVQNTVLPTIEADYADFKKISGSAPGAPAGTPATAGLAVGQVINGPGLHTVVAP